MDAARATRAVELHGSTIPPGESAHYLSDVVAAALVATIAFRLALRLHTRLWEEIDRRRGPQLIMT